MTQSTSLKDMTTASLRNLVFGYQIRLEGLQRRKESPLKIERVRNLLKKAGLELYKREGN